ncbi:MAG: hypothetical protein AAF328_05085 [Planctomycetota bacterium]
MPDNDASLRDWGASFVSQLAASPGGPADVGLSDTQATEFGDAFDAYNAAYVKANTEATRGPVSTQQKNSARDSFRTAARQTVAIVQAYPQTTDDQRRALQITIRDTERTPIDPPEEAPRLQVRSVDGHLVKLRVVDQDNKKRKPAHISGYMLFSYVGENPPADPADYKFVTTESKLDYDFWLASDLVVGQKVWLTAAWLNRKLETGPACQSVMTGPTFGGLSQAA